MKIDKKYGLLVIDGRYYEVDTKDGKPFFKIVSKKKVEDKEKKAKEIAKKLKDNLDGEKILVELLMDYDKKQLETLHNMLFKSKRKYKPKTRKHHCVDMKIGGFILPIID